MLCERGRAQQNAEIDQSSWEAGYGKEEPGSDRKDHQGQDIGKHWRKRIRHGGVMFYFLWNYFTDFFCDFSIHDKYKLEVSKIE